MGFLSLGLKVREVAIFAKRSNDVLQCSENASGSEYTKVLSMLLLLNMPEF